MRFLLEYFIKPPQLPVDYRPLLVSCIHRCLDQQDPDLSQIWYTTKQAKPFTFAVVFGRRQGSIDEHIFSRGLDPKAQIAVGPRLIWQIGCAHLLYGTRLYNALVRSPLIEEAGISLRLQRVRPVLEPSIRGTEAIFETLSPVIIRDPNRSEWYLLPDQEGFLPQLQKEVAVLCTASGYPVRGVAPVLFEPIAIRRVVVFHYNQHIQGIVGAFRLRGPSAILNFVHQGGLGARRSQGFGMLRVVRCLT